MTDREQRGLRGPVRTCSVERRSYSRRCGADVCETEERSYSGTVEFRADGSILREQYRNPNGSECKSTREYDDAGRLTTVRSENGAGSVHLQTYEYDSEGRLIRMVANGRVAETYEYDAAGRKTKTVHVDVAAQDPGTQYSWAVEGTDSSYSAPGVARLTTLYNQRDQPTELLFHDQAGRQLSRVDFRYDEAGRLIEEAQTNAKEALPLEMAASLNQAQLQTVLGFLGTRRSHLYDGKGRRAESRSKIGPFGGDTRLVTYNDHGDPILEIQEHEGREYDMDDEGRLSDSPTSERISRSEANLRYEYDAHGNWIVKTVESRGSAEQEFTLSSVERRAIGYFD